MVLTNTSASFICSPKSHRLHNDIIDLYEARNTENFCKLSNDPSKAKIIETKLLEIGGAWQMPIVVPRGCVILWTSALIHSARPALVKEETTTDDPWRGWRCVVYICLRPAGEFTKEQVLNRAECLLRNRQTNHWGTKVMAKFPTNPNERNVQKHPHIVKLTENPELVYQYIQRPSLENPSILELSGIESCLHDDSRLKDMINLYKNPDIKVDELVTKLSAYSDDHFMKIQFGAKDI